MITHQDAQFSEQQPETREHKADKAPNFSQTDALTHHR